MHHPLYTKEEYIIQHVISLLQYVLRFFSHPPNNIYSIKQYIYPLKYGFYFYHSRQNKAVSNLLHKLIP